MVLNLDRQEMAGAQLAKWDHVRFDFVLRFLHSMPYPVSYRVVVRFLNLGVLFISLSVLFSKTPNSGGAKVLPATPLTTALQLYIPSLKNTLAKLTCL